MQLRRRCSVRTRLRGHRGRDGPALRAIDTDSDIKLLFTDVGLSGNFNGHQLVDEANRRRPDLKVLYTTGYARNAVVHQGRLDPGVALISKPFSYTALAVRIRAIPRRRGPCLVDAILSARRPSIETISTRLVV